MQEVGARRSCIIIAAFRQPGFSMRSSFDTSKTRVIYRSPRMLPLRDLVGATLSLSIFFEMFTRLVLLGFLSGFVRMLLAAPPFIQNDTPFTFNGTIPLQLLDGSNIIASPPLVNISSSPGVSVNTLLSSYSYISFGPILCFADTRPPSALPRFNRVSIVDYLGALERIVIRSDAMELQIFDPGPTKVSGWDYNEARIGVRAPYPPDGAIFQIIFIAHLVGLVAQECLTDSKGFLGGSVGFGSDGQFTAFVGAKRYRPDNVAIS